MARRLLCGICPHRGFRFSYGRFDGKSLECSYHGWFFDGCSSRCGDSFADEPDKLKVERFCRALSGEEHDGYVWVYERGVAPIDDTVSLR
jgi:phenylpropionate dioxygenase-like ring-hydroxylating dioxygenase large terminal subunit